MIRRAGVPRRAAAAVLVIVYAFAVPAALTAGWVRSTILSTSGYTAAMAHPAEDPVVRKAVSDLAHVEVASMVEGLIDDVAAPLPGFVVDAVGDRTADLVDGIVDDFLGSPDLQRLWTAAHAAAHRQLLEVLDGNSASIATADDDVVLDLAPFLRAALAFAADRLTELIGTPVAPPVLDTVPAAACKLVADRAAVTLPPDCGRIPLFSTSQFAGMRRGFGIVRDATLALVVLPALAAVAALALAPRRRSILAWLGASGTATALAVLGATVWMQSYLIAQVSPRFRPVVDANIQALLGDLRAHAEWCASAGVVLAFVALVIRRRSPQGRRSSAQSRLKNPPG